MRNGYLARSCSYKAGQSQPSSLNYVRRYALGRVSILPGEMGFDRREKKSIITLASNQHVPCRGVEYS